MDEYLEHPVKNKGDWKECKKRLDSNSPWEIPRALGRVYKGAQRQVHKKLTGFLRENGVDVIYVDSDGYVHDLIPLWIEGGVNGAWPLEVAAGNDPIELRELEITKIPKRLFQKPPSGGAWLKP